MFDSLVKMIQFEAVPAMIMYMLSIFTLSFQLNGQILFSVGFGGQILTAIGCSFQNEIKILKLIGRAIAHGTTILMLIFFMTKVNCIATPV